MELPRCILTRLQRLLIASVAKRRSYETPATCSFQVRRQVADIGWESGFAGLTSMRRLLLLGVYCLIQRWAGSLHFSAFAATSL